MRTSIYECPAVSIAETLALQPGIVDLWYWSVETLDSPQSVAAYETLLSAEERKRYRRFRFERDQRLFLGTRALIRTVLSRYASVQPVDWRFAIGAYGKPRIAHPVVAPLIHFNVANTPGLLVCAVSIAHESIGVDAEHVDRGTDILRIADRYFSPTEVSALRALPASEQPKRFLAYWTLKESYIKARGAGLRLPLDQFSFLVDDVAIRVSFDTRLADDATRWRFALIDVPPRHVVAVAVDAAGNPLSLRAAHVVPPPPGTS